jgi:hypothetical protein
MRQDSKHSNVITLPVREADPPGAGPLELDDWGRDANLTSIVTRVSQLRWDVEVHHAERMPSTGALLIVNARRFALTSVFTSLALSKALGRPARFVGRPDAAPFGSLMQGIGGLLPNESEIARALRAGELIIVGTGHTTSGAAPGEVDRRLLSTALVSGTPVVPIAAWSSPLRRDARIDVGEPLDAEGQTTDVEAISEIVATRIGSMLAGQQF